MIFLHCTFPCKVSLGCGRHIPLWRPRCPMCSHVSATTITAEGPRHNTTIREHFTCKSSNALFDPSKQLKNIKQVLSDFLTFFERDLSARPKTERLLRKRNGEHLRAIRGNPSGFPVAEHFNKPGHRLDNMEVRCVKQCRSTNTRH